MKISRTAKLVFLAWIIYFHGSVSYGDCFQDVAQRSEAGLIEGFTKADFWETGAPILLHELGECLNVSDTDLYVKIIENFVKMKALKSGTQWEFDMTWALVDYFRKFRSISVPVFIKQTTLSWYRSDNMRKKIFFNILNEYCYDNLDAIATSGLWAEIFTQHKLILDNESDKMSELSLALLDFMFTKGPGCALLTLNPAISGDNVDALKIKLTPLLRLHSWRNPVFRDPVDLDSGMVTINNLISSNYAYIDLFIAEIVNIVHDLRTPEVDAFLKQSNHPLVQKRENEPFVYEHPPVPE